MKQTLFIRAAAIAGLIAVLSVSTRAGTPIRLSFRDTTIASGSALAYPIYVDSSLSGYAVRSYQLEFTYNTSLFTFIGADSSGTVTAGWGAPTFYEISPGRIRIAAAGTDTLAGKGKLVVLKLASNLFTGYTQYGSFYFESSPTITMMNQGSPTLDFRNGTVTILPAPSITISPNTALLTKGDVVQFSVSGGKSPYTWSTSSPSVASIDTLGKLTGLSNGLTKVVCKDSSGYLDTSGVVEVRAFKLSFRDTTRYQGQTLNLPVYCTDLSGLNVVSGKLDIAFSGNLWIADTSVVQTGTLLAGYGQAAVAVGSGTISVAFAGTTPLSGSGVLLYLKLRALTSNYGSSSIAVQSALFNETMTGNVASSTLGVLRLSSITVTPSSSQTLVAGDSLGFTASGGTPPYKWSVSDSQRVSISPAGWLKSKPKSSGKVTVSVQDSIGGTGTSGLVTLYNFRLSIPDTTMIPATFVEVPVYATGTDTAFFSYQMNLSYSTNIYLKLVDINVAGTLSSGMTPLLSIDTVNRTANLAVAGVNAISSGGVLVKLKFAVSASAPPSLTTSIAITGVMFNEGVPAALSKNGSFQIGNRAVVSVSPSTMLLHALIGQKDSSVLTIYNTGNIALTTSVSVSGSSAFSVSPTAVNVAPGDSGKVKVYFKSNVTGLDSALVQLTTNDPLNQVVTIKVKGIGSTTGVQGVPLLVPEAFVLEQNFPNPFNPSTTISYQLPKESYVELRIYSVLGEAVRTLLSETQAAGYKSIVWDGQGDAGLSVSSGIYFYRLKAGEFVQVRKMSLLK